MDNFYIDKFHLRNGIIQYTYWNNLSDAPFGILWVKMYSGEGNKKIALLLNVMTIYNYKRKGVCTALHTSVLNDADILLSATGSNEGGKEFLEKFGFKYNNEIGIWSFVK